MEALIVLRIGPATAYTRFVDELQAGSLTILHSLEVAN